MNFRGREVTQLAVPLSAVSNFISCKNTRAVVAPWFTQQTVQGDGGGGGDGGEAELLLDGSHAETWQEEKIFVVGGKVWTETEMSL